ncbi:MAG TPA: DUF362 domain-containing protein [Acidobacteriota bacterium]|nr:DUF362 domain-containing protein [Acidobacteriota bacterium]
MGFHPNAFGTPGWNPFGDFIFPGQTVLIKPNLVRHIHTQGGSIESVITHGSVIRCVLEYAALALKHSGRIIIADAPVQSADFTRIIAIHGLHEICERVARRWDVPIHLMDLRLSSISLDENHRIRAQSELSGDSKGYHRINLGSESLLHPIDGDFARFRVTNYDCKNMRSHHNTAVHEYLVSKSVLEADCILNVAKLKTHRKVGLTASLKNIVGINGHKDWLPHHRHGSIEEGGDEYRHPSFLKRAISSVNEAIDSRPHSFLDPARQLANRCLLRLCRDFSRDQFFEGSWYGNDTLWRTVLDLNRILRYADRNGEMTHTPQRTCLNIVDGIVAGEGEGPMQPEPRVCGILAAGFNPAAVDAVLATIVGFNFRKIPIIRNAFERSVWPIADFAPEDILFRNGTGEWRHLRAGVQEHFFRFRPPSGWQGHIEL